jgi:drug/metabolite transporter (DMT)-like permease
MERLEGSRVGTMTTHDIDSRGTSLRKTILVLIPAIFAQAGGNVLLSMRMKEIGSSSWLPLVPRAVESSTLWFGTALLIVSFVLFATALSWADLSFVVPAISAEVVLNVVFANYFLHEVVSLTRWTGVLLISIGVILVLRSERQKAKRENEEILRSRSR